MPGHITSSRNSRGPVSQGDRPRPELTAIHELEYQVRQTATGADITLRTAAPIDTEALTRDLVDGLVALGLHTPDVRVSLVEAIPRPGNAGKVRTFVPLTGQS